MSSTDATASTFSAANVPTDSTETDRIGIDGLFRCTDKLRPALQVLPDLCSDDPDGVFIAENDWPMFARTIVPKLTEAGIGFDIPQEVTEAVGTECRIEFYLDRDLYGITCEAVAKYGDFTFQLVPTAKELRGVINPDSRSRASQVKRDLSRESFAVQVVRQLCPTWSSIDVARVKEEDEQAILLMLTRRRADPQIGGPGLLHGGIRWHDAAQPAIGEGRLVHRLEPR